MVIDLLPSSAYNATAHRSAETLAVGLSTRPLEDSPMPTFDDATIARFWKSVPIGDSDACWPWRLRCDRWGYGRFAIKNQRLLAHRVAFELSTKPLGTQHVCHSCDNPPCCNPAHLFLGTHQDNMADATQKGHFRGTNNGRAILCENDVLNIRAMNSKGAPIDDIAKQYGVSQGAIRHVICRTSWGWLAP